MEIDVKDAERDKYASIAAKRTNKPFDDEAALAHAFGHSDGALDSISEEANPGISCGTPADLGGAPA